MIADIGVFLLGVILLYLGSDWLVCGASSLASHAKIPKSIAGLTLVAMGTSAPELFVNVVAAFEGCTELALANVSGSNMANICLGLGLCGVGGGIAVRKIEFRIDVWTALSTTALVVIFFFGTPGHLLPLWSVVLLSLGLAWYGHSLFHRVALAPDQVGIQMSLWRTSVFFVGGVVGLSLGGQLIVERAVKLAHDFQVSKDIIALTAIAFGTSIPDISATLAAARRRENGIAVGNILGSNICNILLVLNGTLMASRAGLPSSPEVRFDYLFVVLVSGVIVIITYTSEQISRRTGWCLVIGYCGYLAGRIACVNVHW